MTTAVLSSETASTSRGSDLGLPGRRRRLFFAQIADRRPARRVVSPFDNTADTSTISTSDASTTSSSDDENDVENSSLHRHTGIFSSFYSLKMLEFRLFMQNCTPTPIINFRSRMKFYIRCLLTILFYFTGDDAVTQGAYEAVSIQRHVASAEVHVPPPVPEDQASCSSFKVYLFQITVFTLSIY